ncbi:LEA type 2 family protein [candidate division KSB1 bacterium]|nr:LEA type 2 family protein [candidate division KSB1 bacterium]
MKLYIKSILLAGIALFLGCAAVSELIQAPTVSINKVNLRDVSFDDITLDFDLRINNPNAFGAQLNGFDYAFSIEEKLLMSGDENRNIFIAAANQSNVNIPLTLKFKDIYDLVTKTKSMDSLAFKISGHFQPGGLLAGFSIPFSKSGRLPNVRLPKISFNGVRVGKLSLTSADLDVDIDIDNLNVFGFDLGKLDYKLNMGGSQVATGIKENLASIPAKGKGKISIPVKINFLNLTQSLRALINGNQIDVAIDGTADLKSPFGAMTMPFNKAQTVNVFRF